MQLRRKNICLGAMAALFAVIYGNLVFMARSHTFSIQEMDQTRGTSQMACKFQQTCDEYNRYSLNCAGQSNGTPCDTCFEPSKKVTYLQQADGVCVGGWKYDNLALVPRICGGVSVNASCLNNVCDAATFSTELICDQPNVIIQQ